MQQQQQQQAEWPCILLNAPLLCLDMVLGQLGSVDKQAVMSACHAAMQEGSS